MARIDLLKTATEGGPSPRRRRIILGIVAVLGGVFALYVVGTMFTEYIPPYEAAVKQSRYSGGLSAKVYPGPGLYFTGPGVTFHHFPMVVQTLTMNSDSAESAQKGPYSRTVNSLEVDSSDGSKITIDATILYRIVDPYAVMTNIGPGRLFEDNAIIPKASQALKQSLGALKAEDFYSETLRIQATAEAAKLLNEQVSALGLQIDHVLIRQYTYLEGYQKQIEDRKVQDQLVFTNQSMAEAARMEASRQKLDAEGQAGVDVEQQRGDSEVKKIEAEADLYSRKKHAEGDLLVSLAEAQGTELENAAYKSGAGSDNIVGMEMADVLKGVDVIYVQGGPGGTNVLDLNQTLRMFDVGGQ
jgi:regulator of protease activity HflC (stomatin/prohibitin superfamily)